MADADVSWLQRLENYERALATLERALSLAAKGLVASISVVLVSSRTTGGAQVLNAADAISPIIGCNRVVVGVTGEIVALKHQHPRLTYLN